MWKTPPACLDAINLLIDSADAQQKAAQAFLDTIQYGQSLDVATAHMKRATQLIQQATPSAVLCKSLS